MDVVNAQVAKQKRVRVGRRVECDQRPGETFTLEEAAKLCGTSGPSLRVAIWKRETGRGRGIVKGLTFNWVGKRSEVAPPAPPVPTPVGLTPDEVAKLIRTLMQGRAREGGDDVQRLLRWAAGVRREVRVLDRLLAGEAADVALLGLEVQGEPVSTEVTEPVKPAVAPVETWGERRARVQPAAAPVTPDITLAWEGYKATGDIAARNVLMEHYLHVVWYQAERIHTRLPALVDVEDLVSAGVFGLIDALNKFDLSRGLRFQTYCAPRVRGAILDWIREMDFTPRLVRARRSKFNTAARELEQLHGRVPTTEEIGEHLKLSAKAFERVARDARDVGITSLSRKWFETDSLRDVREIDMLEDHREPDRSAQFDRNDTFAHLVRTLPREMRLIMRLYYVENLNMKDIGRALGVCESRVSQLHAMAIGMLKSVIPPPSEEVN